MNSSAFKLAVHMPSLLGIWRKLHDSGDFSLPKHVLTPTELYDISLSVKNLSKGLTGERKMTGRGYMSDPASLGAYLLSFWPVSYAQAALLLDGTGLSPRKALDLGSGPGPLSLALLDLGAEVTACDRSPEALDLARKIAETAGYKLKTSVWDAALSSQQLPQGPFDFIGFGHFLNELWGGRADRIERRTKLVLEAAESLSDDGHLLIMEPALKETTLDLLRLRDGLAAKGWFVHSPCFYQGPCPALLAGATCHGEFDWEPPRIVREIGRRSRVSDRNSLKMSYLILSRKSSILRSASAAESAGNTDGPYRVVSEPMLSKSGRVRIFVCGQKGRFTLSAKRSGAASSLRAFFQIMRGDIITFSGTEKRENGLGLTSESRIKIIKERARV